MHHMCREAGVYRIWCIIQDLWHYIMSEYRLALLSVAAVDATASTQNVKSFQVNNEEGCDTIIKSRLWDLQKHQSSAKDQSSIGH